MSERVAHWQKGLAGENLQDGDRVAILLGNRWEWVAFDQAALGLNLVVVPLYVNDSPENIVHVLRDCGARLLLIQDPVTWQGIQPLRHELPQLERVVCLDSCDDPDQADPLLRSLGAWLPATGGPVRHGHGDPGRLATIIYTSGTTGPPKGVMLSHGNILADAYNALRLMPVFPDDLFLSFLPLSHALERTAGYYLPMMAGATVAYARSIADLAADLRTVRPTALISVPRIYERIHQRVHQGLEQASPLARGLFRLTVHSGWQAFRQRQGRRPWGPDLLLWPLLKKLVASRVQDRLGGRLRVAVCGGAPLAHDVARFFIGLDIPIIQGYGLTETAPIISVNPLEENDPATVGRPLPGLETRIADNGELLVRGPSVMLGYWHNDAATRDAIDTDGWLHTGDLAEISDRHIRITGRLKEIIVMANGRKVPPADMEASIAADPLFQQVLIVGEGAPYLSALAVLDPEAWRRLAGELQLDPQAPDVLDDHRVKGRILARMAEQLRAFPGFARVRDVHPTLTPWTIEAGLMTPTLKPRRQRILTAMKGQVARLYAGHGVYGET